MRAKAVQIILKRCLGHRDGEPVLVVTDAAMEPFARAFQRHAQALGCRDELVPEPATVTVPHLVDGHVVAGELALAGVDTVVLERRPSQQLSGARALGISARTIEVRASQDRLRASEERASAEVAQEIDEGTDRLAEEADEQKAETKADTKGN